MAATGRLRIPTFVSRVFARRPLQQPEIQSRALWLAKGTVTTGLLSGVVMGIGDYTCQSLLAGRALDLKGWNQEQSLVMWKTGTLLSGPTGHLWQVCVERMVPGTGTLAIVCKIAANATYAFTVGLPVTFLTVTFLKGGTLNEGVAKIRDSLVDTWAAGFCYWPFVNLIVFRFITLEHRAVCNVFAGIAWNVYLSFQVNRHVTHLEASSSGDTGEKPLQCQKVLGDRQPLSYSTTTISGSSAL